MNMQKVLTIATLNSCALLFISQQTFANERNNNNTGQSVIFSKKPQLKNMTPAPVPIDPARTAQASSSATTDSLSTTTETDSSKRTEASVITTSAETQAPTGIFGSLWSMLASSSNNHEPQSSQASQSSNLSEQLQKQSLDLLAFRREQLARRQREQQEQDLAYQQLFQNLSKTTTYLKEKPDDFIPSRVKHVEENLLTIRKIEELSAKTALGTSLIIANQTKELRGTTSSTLRDNGQTKAQFRAPSPIETLETFATRVAKLEPSSTNKK